MSQLRSRRAILLSLMAVVEPMCEGGLMARMSGVLHRHLNRAVNTDLNTHQPKTSLSGFFWRWLQLVVFWLLSLVPAAVQRVLDEGWKKWALPCSQLDPDPKWCGQRRWWWEFSSFFGDPAQPAWYQYLTLQTWVVFHKKVFAEKMRTGFLPID